MAGLQDEEFEIEFPSNIEQQEDDIEAENTHSPSDKENQEDNIKAENTLETTEVETVPKDDDTNVEEVVPIEDTILKEHDDINVWLIIKFKC